MQLEYVIICENAFTDDVGRLTIVQTFDYIKASNFPAIHPKMSIVTKWRLDEKDEKAKEHSQKIEIIERDSEKVVFTLPNFGLMAKPGQDKYLQYISNITNLKFNKKGAYLVKIYMNDKEIKRDVTFEVRKVAEDT